MVDQSDSPPNSSDYKIQNPVPHVESAVGNVNDASIGSVKEKSETSVFVNSEPIREEQVQNAVKFLSHPKVRGSPVQYRRSFLEKKGLTKEEIDEAFTRVPDPTPTVSSSQAVVANQDGLKTSPSIQPQVLSQTQQQTPGVHGAASVARFGTLSRFRWTHALLAVGLLAASGAGTAVLFKKSIIPRLKSWIRKVVIEEEEAAATDKSVTINKPSLEEEATAAAKSAATAAADVARASQEMLIAKTEEKKYFEELTKLLNIQVTEMKSMSNALQKLEGQSNASVRVTTIDSEDQRIAMTNSQPIYTNGKVDAYSEKSPAPPAFVESSVAPHPKSYMEIMGMIERGEKPPNIREINDQPPNPNQPVPNPRLTPKLKPWEIGQKAQINSVNGVQYQEMNTHGVSMISQTSQFNGDGGSAPWSQNKNLKITELETEDADQKTGSSSSVLFNAPQPPVQRSWVPPQPPPVAMQEAAAAIRQPKKPPTQRQQQQQYTDDQLLARSSSSSSEITDELQRVTEISESGGAINNLDSHGFSSNEILQQKEDDNSYVES